MPYYCKCCGERCDETKPEEMVIVTADMSGCELRIIAELSGDPVWIAAFAAGEDVHSVGTEILYAKEWPTLTEEGCAYFAINPETGKPLHHKCSCKGHKKLRDATKAVNFLLAYGGGPDKLAESIGVTRDEAVALMQLHEKMFPKVWRYLERSGEDAKYKYKSFDMFRGRRLFPKPTPERAYQRAIDNFEEDLRLDEDEAAKNLKQFEERTGRRAIGEDRFKCTHREPTENEIKRAWGSLAGSVERQGKNHAIQGTNARIIKIAMSCGQHPDGYQYLWHTLPRYKARLIKMVHDELVVTCPRRFGQQVADLIGEAFKKAASEVMTKVEMQFDFKIDSHWSK